MSQGIYVARPATPDEITKVEQRVQAAFDALIPNVDGKALAYVGSLDATINANPRTITIDGALVGDKVLCTMVSDDTGATLGDILGAAVTADDTVVLDFEAGPTGNDGVVNVMVFREVQGYGT